MEADLPEIGQVSRGGTLAEDFRSNTSLSKTTRILLALTIGAGTVAGSTVTDIARAPAAEAAWNYTESRCRTDYSGTGTWTVRTRVCYRDYNQLSELYGYRDGWYYACVWRHY